MHYFSSLPITNLKHICFLVDRHKYNIMCALTNRTTFLSLRERESLEDSVSYISVVLHHTKTYLRLVIVPL